MQSINCNNPPLLDMDFSRARRKIKWEYLELLRCVQLLRETEPMILKANAEVS
jgi:hypothetical protein